MTGGGFYKRLDGSRRETFAPAAAVSAHIQQFKFFTIKLRPILDHRM